MNTYHYKESGLDNIWLASGFDIVSTPSGKQVKIKDVEGLHKAIGEALIKKKKNLTGKELRFIRQEMLLSQANLAKLLEVTEQTVHRWESAKSDIPKPAESLIRFIYAEREKLDIGGKNLMERLKDLADLEDKLDGMQLIKHKNGWKANAAA